MQKLSEACSHTHQHSHTARLALEVLLCWQESALFCREVACQEEAIPHALPHTAAFTEEKLYMELLAVQYAEELNAGAINVYGNKNEDWHVHTDL